MWWYKEIINIMYEKKNIIMNYFFMFFMIPLIFSIGKLLRSFFFFQWKFLKGFKKRLEI